MESLETHGLSKALADDTPSTPSPTSAMNDSGARDLTTDARALRAGHAPRRSYADPDFDSYPATPPPDVIGPAVPAATASEELPTTPFTPPAPVVVAATAPASPESSRGATDEEPAGATAPASASGVRSVAVQSIFEAPQQPGAGAPTEVDPHPVSTARPAPAAEPQPDAMRGHDMPTDTVSAEPADRADAALESPAAEATAPAAAPTLHVVGADALLESEDPAKTPPPLASTTVEASGPTQPGDESLTDSAERARSVFHLSRRSFHMTVTSEEAGAPAAAPVPAVVAAKPARKGKPAAVAPPPTTIELPASYEGTPAPQVGNAAKGGHKGASMERAVTMARSALIGIVLTAFAGGIVTTVALDRVWPRSPGEGANAEAARMQEPAAPAATAAVAPAAPAAAGVAAPAATPAGAVTPETAAAAPATAAPSPPTPAPIATRPTIAPTRRGALAKAARLSGATRAPTRLPEARRVAVVKPKFGRAKGKGFAAKRKARALAAPAAAERAPAAPPANYKDPFDQ